MEQCLNSADSESEPKNSQEVSEKDLFPLAEKGILRDFDYALSEVPRPFLRHGFIDKCYVFDNIVITVEAKLTCTAQLVQQVKSAALAGHGTYALVYKKPKSKVNITQIKYYGAGLIYCVPEPTILFDTTLMPPPLRADFLHLRVWPGISRYNPVEYIALQKEWQEAEFPPCRYKAKCLLRNPDGRCSLRHPKIRPPVEGGYWGCASFLRSEDMNLPSLYKLLNGVDAEDWRPEGKTKNYFVTLLERWYQEASALHQKLASACMTKTS